MDSPKPPHRPAHLLDDLESIREFLVGNGTEPPLLTESVDPALIPLLSDVVSPGNTPVERADPPPSRPAPASPVPAPTSAPLAPAPAMASGMPRPPVSAGEQARLNIELRAAAQLILQDVIDDFVPQIEAELKRRLEARLSRLIAQRKG